MEASIEESLYRAVVAEDQEAVINALSKGANPNKTASQGKTSLGEAANIGSIDIVKLLINASEAKRHAPVSYTGSSKKRLVKCHKRKLRHNGQHDETVVKCKNLNDRTFKDFHFGQYEAVGVNETSSKADANQGYFVFIHSEGSSSDESKMSVKSPITSSPLTPSPQADLEWDEDIGNVAPTTSEDETWSSMYKWYAAILESTGAAIASASVVTNGIDQHDAFMQTALHYAAEQGHAGVVKLLIEAGCKVDAETGDGVTALHVAVIKNYIDIVKILIKAGSNVNHKTYDRMTPLHFATSRGFLDLVKFLVSHGASLEARDANERTALYIAAGRCHEDVIKYLIDAGANVNSEEIHGYTPLCEAVWQKFPMGVKQLLLSGARITHSHRLLHNAIIQRQVEIVELLTAYGAGINLYNDNGDTPLLLAARLSQPEVAKILLRKGANANLCNSITGANVLHIAVESITSPEEFEELLKCVIDYKIDMNATALTGDTALNRALLLHKDHAAVLLIRYGADVNTCDLHSCGLDNLSIASRRRSCSLASMLLKAGHYVTVPDQGATVPKPGCTAYWLYHACKQPLSLSDLCRIKIRRVCSSSGVTLFRSIASLPLPKSLKRYLMMEDGGLY
uniref:SOCS box domain-containing protein n=1 Tax=Heliothis virescens TaxID=7102 RepID=A0A2A4K1M0_HELVI